MYFTHPDRTTRVGDRIYDLPRASRTMRTISQRRVSVGFCDKKCGLKTKATAICIPLVTLLIAAGILLYFFVFKTAKKATGKSVFYIKHGLIYEIYYDNTK